MFTASIDTSQPKDLLYRDLAASLAPRGRDGRPREPGERRRRCSTRRSTGSTGAASICSAATSSCSGPSRASRPACGSRSARASAERPRRGARRSSSRTCTPFPGTSPATPRPARRSSFPFVADGRLVGVLDVDAPEPDRFDEEDRAGLERFVKSARSGGRMGHADRKPMIGKAFTGGKDHLARPRGFPDRVGRRHAGRDRPVHREEPEVPEGVRVRQARRRRRDARPLRPLRRRRDRSREEERSDRRLHLRALALLSGEGAREGVRDEQGGAQTIAGVEFRMVHAVHSAGTSGKQGAIMNLRRATRAAS